MVVLCLLYWRMLSQKWLVENLAGSNVDDAHANKFIVVSYNISFNREI